MSQMGITNRFTDCLLNTGEKGNLEKQKYGICYC